MVIEWEDEKTDSIDNDDETYHAWCDAFFKIFGFYPVMCEEDER